jgi:tRNA threonylcarbamoyladenosine biosynthesis protein TsaE
MPAVLELSVDSAEAMRELGAVMATLLSGGDVVVLTGDLGAGKTTFVQGAARALGVTDPVLSPTFTLVRRYLGSRPIYHVDVYRLDRMQEAIDLGIEDLFEPDGVTFVEWGDVIEGLLPDAYLELEMWTRPEDDGRFVVVSASGRTWAERWERLHAVTRAWATQGAAS